jgi:epoxyqueuosine reductase
MTHGSSADAPVPPRVGANWLPGCWQTGRLTPPWSSGGDGRSRQIGSLTNRSRAARSRWRRRQLATGLAGIAADPEDMHFGRGVLNGSPMTETTEGSVPPPVAAAAKTAPSASQGHLATLRDGVPVDISELTAQLKAQGRRLGFDLIGVAPAVSPLGWSQLQAWLDAGFAGEMAYMHRFRPAYEHPRSILNGVASVVMVAVNYKTDDLRHPRESTPSRSPPDSARPVAEPAFEPALMRSLDQVVESCPRQPPVSSSVRPAGSAQVARYARGVADYHVVLKERLQRLADWLHGRRPGCRTRCVVDTAPLLERDFARLAGLGWFGKNTLLIDRRAGSFLFLGALLTDLALEFDAPHETSHCGTCRRCLDVCPTEAFPEPYVLDARRCVAYLTIELRGAIPAELRPGLNNWLFGCDDCQTVCPWNRKPAPTTDPVWQPVDQELLSDPAVILNQTEAEFLQSWGQRPLARPGWIGLRRNAALVLGNSGQPQAVADLLPHLDDPHPVVRGAVAWSLGQLAGQIAVSALQAQLVVEDNPEVQAELKNALAAAEVAR